MDLIRVGVAGFGNIAQAVHIPNLTKLPGVEVVAIADSDPQRREIARRCVPRVEVLSSCEDLLQIPEVEAAVICLPTALHAEATAAALQKGKHVFLEKPLATTLNKGRLVVDAWQRAGVVGMMGFNYRFNPLYQDARRRIQARQLGNLVGVQTSFSHPRRDSSEWRQARASGGGVLLDLASHHLDLVRFLIGQEVKEVHAWSRSQFGEEDSAMLQMHLADGTLVQSSFSACSPDEDRLEVMGEAGRLIVDRYLSLDAELTRTTPRFARLKRLGRELQLFTRAPYWLSKLRSPLHEPSYLACLTEFFAAIRNRREVAPDLWDGYVNLAVVEAAAESARSGRVAQVRDVGNRLPRMQSVGTE